TGLFIQTWKSTGPGEQMKQMRDGDLWFDDDLQIADSDQANNIVDPQLTQTARQRKASNNRPFARLSIMLSPPFSFGGKVDADSLQGYRLRSRNVDVLCL